jgi:hypothetical protein
MWQFIDKRILLASVIPSIFGVILILLAATKSDLFSDKDVVLTIGSVMVGQFSLLLAELPHASEQQRDSKKNMNTLFLLGVDLSTICLLGNTFPKKELHEYTGRITAYCTKLGISENDILNRVNKMFQADSNEILPIAKELLDWIYAYLPTIDESFMTMYDAGSKIVTLLNGYSHGGFTSTIFLESKSKLEHAKTKISKSKNSMAGKEILNPIFEKIEKKDNDIVNWTINYIGILRKIQY